MLYTVRTYSINESGFSFTVKLVSDSLGISNGLLAVNNRVNKQQ